MHASSGNPTLLKMSHCQQPGLARIKVVMLGAPGVGKTALMHKFLGKAPMCRLTMQTAVDTKDSVLETSPTVGVDFATCTISKTDGDPLRLNLWDTSGQQCFRYMVDGYLNGLQDHDAVLIVYDVSDLESFKEVDACIGRVHRLARGCPQIALVGMKADLKDRVVSYSDGRNKANAHGIPVFAEASAAESFVKQEHNRVFAHSIEQDIFSPLVQHCCTATGEDVPLQIRSPQPQAVPLDHVVRAQPSSPCDHGIRVLQSLQRCSKPLQRCSKPLLQCLHLS